jgi:putative transposase
MPYWQLFYHLVWTTKSREPFLTSEVEPIVYGFVRSKVIGLGGTLFALNGTAEHVHVVTAIPPAIAVAKFVGQVKGATATRFNKGGFGAILYWQEEYGAFSFDGKRLPNFVSYVERQKEHHAENKTIPILERTADGGVKPARETAPTYEVGSQAWWDELAAWEKPPGHE